MTLYFFSIFSFKDENGKTGEKSYLRGVPSTQTSFEEEPMKHMPTSCLDILFLFPKTQKNIIIAILNHVDG